MSADVAHPVPSVVAPTEAPPAARDDWFDQEPASGTTDPRATVGTAWRAIRSNALRSLLTALGVIIGVAAVVALTAIGAGVTGDVTANLERLGTNLLTITGTVSRQQTGSVRAEGAVTVGDAEALVALQPLDPRIAGVAPFAQTNEQARAGSLNTNVTVVGTWTSYAAIRDLEVASGAWWTDLDEANRQRVAVLGHDIALELFPDQDPVGQTLRLGTHTFTVVGVLPDKGAGFASPNRQVLVPLATYLQRLARSQVAGGTSEQTVNQVLVRGAEASDLSDLQAMTTALLAERRDETDPATYTFQVQNQADTLDSLADVTRTLTLFLGVIAGISLLVGGIGIMNIMLVSVTERTREIGIRKALGARPGDIRFQFLVEAIVLSAGGGLVGLGLGIGAAVVAGPPLGLAPAFTATPMLVAFAVALATGVVFGSYPAQRAAGLDPVESLRYG